MTELGWLKKVSKSVYAGDLEKEGAGEVIKDVTSIRLVIGVAGGKNISLYLVENEAALQQLKKYVQSGLTRGASKEKINYNIAGSSVMHTVTIKESSNLPWYLELFKNITSAFLAGGGAAFAAAVAALIVGSPVTPWMFLAAFVLLALGTGFHLVYLRLG
jgi:hypothetical protein